METNLTERGTKKDNQMQLPKNIRQIGNVQGSVRIYMEDYVYTYLHGMGRDDWAHRGSIFVGTCSQQNGQKYLFVSGLVHIPDDCFHDGTPTFGDLMWGSVYQEIKCFYDGVEILGWGMDVAGASAKLTGNLEQLHRRAFSGQEKFAFLMDSLEKEEAFYIYEKNMLRRRDGYYVYYEKNPQMREYMMQGKETETTVEIDPQQVVVNHCRKVSAQNKKQSRKVFLRAAYASCLVFVAAASALGVNLLGDARKNEKTGDAVPFFKTDGTSVESNALPVDSAAVQAQIDKNESETVQEMEDTKLQDAQTEQVGADEQEVDVSEPADTVERTDEQGEDAEVPSEVSEEKEQSENEKDADTSKTSEKNEQTTETAAPAQRRYYTVKAGESLIGISKKIYGRDCTKQLCELNALEDENKIYAGQKLFLLNE